MTATTPSEADGARRDVDRLVAFSDGVFAIAITLLVVSIEVPDVADKELGQALKDLSPQLLTYALSFFVIGLYWIAHHRTFRSLVRVDRTLLWLNLALLGFVALLPLPTEILGKYNDTTLAVVIYAAAICTTGTVSILLWRYIVHAGLTPPLNLDIVRLGTFRAGIAPAVFALSIPIAFASPQIAQLSWLLILPANAVVERRYGKDSYNG